MMPPPLIGWRHIGVTDQRTADDLAQVPGWLAEELYPDAAKWVLVTDNLNTHGPWCLYEALDPGRARRIGERREWHGTPRHGSWLNVAEVELAALTRPCPDRRIGSVGHPRRVAAAWEEERNERREAVRWRLTASDARIKLRSLDPSIRE